VVIPERSADAPVAGLRDHQRITSDTPQRRPVHNAAQWRKRLRRELQRVGAGEVSLYIDGPRGIARFRFADLGGVNVPAEDALHLLRALPNGAGVERTLSSLERT
jgi:hypothetical protein